MGKSNIRKIKDFFGKIKITYWLIPILFLIIFLIKKKESTLFNSPYSTVLRSSDDYLLSVKISDDEQWRFPPLDSIPHKFKVSSMLFEDEYFYFHPGVNPVSLIKAFYKNYNAGKIVSGGSTITMQTIRMALGNKKRTYLQKLIEILKSFLLEIRLKKEIIFKLYANNAPFGGNVVGLNAASWRYYSKSPFRLSWAEAATLAVLPNNPKSIFPGKNQKLLLDKRNRLLDKICDREWISKEDLILYKSEPIPLKIKPLPNHAPHLLHKAISEFGGQKNISSTINFDLQKRTVKELNRYSNLWSKSEIHNAAALIVEIDSGNILAYVGNSNTKVEHAKFVDIICASRSPGSILKPILYSACVDESIILPNELLPDIPVFYDGFIPKNFDKKFRGAIPADEALTSSLNVPFVFLLRKYGQEKFYHLLQKVGFNSFEHPPNHYGLSIVLGGAESSLWELTSIYSSMARAYSRYFERPFKKEYSNFDYHSIKYVESDEKNTSFETEEGIFDIGALDATFKAMEKLKRPVEESGWESFTSSKNIAWKTGTSFGLKDAWAIGLNEKYLVGVWIGNADGEGRPDLVGAKIAAPLMFNLFSFLDGDTILKNQHDWEDVEICVESGMLLNDYCENQLTINLSQKILMGAKKCNYHQIINLNEEKTYQVNNQCYSVSKMIKKKWFILPPSQAWYFRNYNPNYDLPPPFLLECQEIDNYKNDLQLIYPHSNANLYIPKEQDGSKGKVVFQAVHSVSDSLIYWYIDSEYIGSTKEYHQIEINPSKGEHLLLLVDSHGNELKRKFTVLN